MDIQTDARRCVRSYWVVTQLDLEEQKMTFELPITYRILNRPAS